MDRSTTSAKKVTDDLLHEALKRESRDNVSVLLVRTHAFSTCTTL